MKTIYILLMALTGAVFQNRATTSVTINITNLENNKGSVLVALYNKADNFPHDAARNAVGRKKVAIVNKTATITWTDLPPGRYAVALLHDANNNMKMDYNMLGMPKEGYGFSNNAKGKMSAPGFDKAAFELGTTPKTIFIKMQYFL